MPIYTDNVRHFVATFGSRKPVGEASPRSTETQPSNTGTGTMCGGHSVLRSSPTRGILRACASRARAHGARPRDLLKETRNAGISPGNIGTSKIDRPGHQSRLPPQRFAVLRDRAFRSRRFSFASARATFIGKISRVFAR